MKEAAYYTPRTRPRNYSGGQPFRAGATWVYAPSTGAYRQGLLRHIDRLSVALKATILTTSPYLTTLARKDPELRRYERSYILFLANAACRDGSCGKILARSLTDTVYGLYFASRNAGSVRKAVAEAVRATSRERVIRFSELAQRCFGTRKGSYYWARGVCEHLVYLDLARHQDRWSVRGMSEHG